VDDLVSILSGKCEDAEEKLRRFLGKLSRAKAGGEV